MIIENLEIVCLLNDMQCHKADTKEGHGIQIYVFIMLSHIVACRLNQTAIF